jgi:NIPSNAP
LILDLRTYTMVPGRLGDFLKSYEAEGLPVQIKHQGEPVGYFFTEVGPLNQVVHMWRYASMADREQRRTELEADPAWKAYRAKSAERGTVQHQENKILRPTPFSPMK